MGGVWAAQHGGPETPTPARATRMHLQPSLLSESPETPESRGGWRCIRVARAEVGWGFGTQGDGVGRGCAHLETIEPVRKNPKKNDS